MTALGDRYVIVGDDAVVLVDSEGHELTRRPNSRANLDVVKAQGLDGLAPDQRLYKVDAAHPIVAKWRQRQIEQEAPQGCAPEIDRESLAAMRSEVHLCGGCRRVSYCTIGDAVAKAERETLAVVSACLAFEENGP